MLARRHLPHWAIVAALLVTSGCAVRARGRVQYGAQATITVASTAPREVVVSRPPPPLRAQAVVGAQPGPDAVWCPGHYAWNGSWTWVPGRWERDRAGYVWVAPVAHRRGGRIVYHGGYWRRDDAAPPPVYATPGLPVARPAPPRVVATPGRPVPPRGSVTVTATPARPAQPPRRGVTVTATPARPAQPPRRGVTVTATPARPAQPPRRGVTVTATPGRRGTVTATPGGRGTVTATPARPPQTAVRQPDRVTTPAPRPARPPQATVREPGAVREQPGPGRVTTPPPRPAPSTPAPRARVTVPSRTPPARRADEIRVPLRCRLGVARAPMGGIVTLTGSGFASSARVVIGGTTAAIVSNRPDRLQVRVPGSSGGGQVRVVQGEQSATCGQLSISSR